MRRSTTGSGRTSDTRRDSSPIIRQPADQSLRRIHVHGRQDRSANRPVGQFLEYLHDQLRQSVHDGGHEGDRLPAQQPRQRICRDLPADAVKPWSGNSIDLHGRRRNPISGRLHAHPAPQRGRRPAAGELQPYRLSGRAGNPRATCRTPSPTTLITNMAETKYLQVFKNEESQTRLLRSVNVVNDPRAGSATFGQPVCRSVLDGSDPSCVHRSTISERPQRRP